MAGQRRCTPAATSAPAATEWALGAPPPPPPPPAPAPIRFEQDSLFAIAPTLRKLDVSSCHLDDEAVELFVVLQELEDLEMPRNALSSVDRLQQLATRARARTPNPHPHPHPHPHPNPNPDPDPNPDPNS